MKTARNIVVKTSLNADEYVNFKHQCELLDIPQARALRDLANGMCRNHSRTVVGIERPELVHKPYRCPPNHRPHSFRLRQ